MKQITTVFSYTLKEAARKKAFIVSTVIIMIMVLALCLAPRIISAVKGGGEEKNTDAGTENASEQIAADEDAPVCYLIDQTGIFEKDMDTLRSVYIRTGILRLLQKRRRKTSVLISRKMRKIP